MGDQPSATNPQRVVLELNDFPIALADYWRESGEYVFASVEFGVIGADENEKRALTKLGETLLWLLADIDAMKDDERTDGDLETLKALNARFAPALNEIKKQRERERLADKAKEILDETLRDYVINYQLKSGELWQVGHSKQEIAKLAYVS